MEIKIFEDGSFSAEAKERFGIGNLSSSNDSGVFIGNLTLDISGSAYPTITINVGNPGLVSVSASKSFSPELAIGEGTTVYLRLMRKHKVSGDYVDDATFNAASGHLATLDGTDEAQSGSAPYESAGWTATWTGLDRYDNNDQPYQYYVVEVQSDGSSLDSSGNIDLTITGGSNPGHRTYSVTQSNAVTADENTGDITDLTVKNESVDATVTKTWANYTPVQGDVIYLQLQSTTAASFTVATTNDITNVDLITVTMGESSPSETHNSLSGSTVVLSTGTNTWTVLVKGLPKKTAGGDTILYRFVETESTGTAFTNGSINGAWTVAYSTTSPYSVIQSTSLPEAYQSGTTFSTAVTNTLEKTDITLTKAWTGTTGSSITMMLEWTEDTWPSTPGSTANDLKFTVNASNLEGKTSAQPYQVQASGPQILAYLESGNWVVVVKDMQKHSGGTVRKYRFIEMNGASPVAQDGVVGGFKVGYGVSTGNYPAPATATYSQTISNTPANVDIVVEKVFTDSSDSPITSTISDKIYVKLRRTNSGGNTEADDTFNSLSDTGNPVVEISKDASTNKFTYKWVDQPKTNGSNTYRYSVIEVEPDPNTSGTYRELTNNKIKLSNVIYTVTQPSAQDVNLASQADMNFTITNKVNQPKLSIHKESDDASPVSLAGAKFTLQRKKDKSGTDVNDPAVVSGETASDGNITFSQALADGTYELWESTAPAGYAMHSGKVTFTVINGVFTVTTPIIPSSGLKEVSSGVYFTVDTSGKEAIFTLRFQNTAGTELPGTGTVFGLSRMGFASLGTVLLAAFVAVYQYKKRRQYNGDWKE